MIRKSILALSLLVMTLGTVAVSAGAANASVGPHKTTPPVTFTGKITCAIAKTSTITFKPGLPFGPKTAKVTITVNASLTNCKGKTSQGGATIVSGTATGKTTVSASCESLVTSVPSPKGTIVWTTKAKGKTAADSTTTLSKGKLTASKAGIVTETFDSKQKGSFAGSGSVEMVLVPTETQLLAACGTKAGLTKIKVASGKLVAG